MIAIPTNTLILPISDDVNAPVNGYDDFKLSAVLDADTSTTDDTFSFPHDKFRTK